MPDKMACPYPTNSINQGQWIKLNTQHLAKPNGLKSGNQICYLSVISFQGMFLHLGSAQ